MSQDYKDEKFSIRVTADLGIRNVLNIENALPDMTTKSASTDFEISFGWSFWRYQRHSLEANLGVGFGRTNIISYLPKLDFHYSAPAAADMDDEPYIRYYEADKLSQNISVSRMLIPIYLSYSYQISRIFSVNALVGFKANFALSSKVGKSSVDVFSYGVYPQYDDLLIDASYMNEFGEAKLDTSHASAPDVNAFGATLLAGIGVEARIWGPLAAGVSFRYEGGMNNVFKASETDITKFDSDNAPITYTVAGGQKVRSLTNYLSESKLSQFSCGISLIYHF